MHRRALLLAAAALTACGGAAQTPPPSPFPMRRGVNLGNALEAPNEGDWGYRIEPAHLIAIASAGFDGVRLPVRWDAHMEAQPPFTIAPVFLARVRDVVATALSEGLKIQLDVHHFEALNTSPDANTARFTSLWRQIAEAFAGAPEGLIFEPLNEPNGPMMHAGVVSRLQALALAEIRAHHPTRLVVLGGPNWNSIDGLNGWTPPADPHTAVTVHYYEPHAFTHDGASWLDPDAPHFGRRWGGARDEAAIRAHAATAARWARDRGLALQLGEFGVNTTLPPDQRAVWLRATRLAFEAEGATWCVWDFAGAFALFDLTTQRFNQRLLDNLLH